MAKSIEQKAVEALANILSDSRFRYPEFARLMIEQHPQVHKSFFMLFVSYINYLSVSTKYNYFVNDTEKEAKVAYSIVDSLNKALTKERLL